MADETATLKMRFVFDGPPPPQPRIGGLGAAGAIPDESLLVDPISKGIKNVVVFIDTGSKGAKIASPPTAETSTPSCDNQFTFLNRVF